MTLRLAMVTPYPEEPGAVIGGVEAVAHCLAQALREVEAIDFHILAPCGRRTPGIERRDGMTIHWLPLPKLPGFINFWIIYRRTIHRCLAEIKPDIVHFHSHAVWTLGYSGPYVLTIHGIAEKDILFTSRRLLHKIIGWVERIGRRRCRDTIVINPYVSDELGEQIVGRRWPIENPVAPEFFQIERSNNTPRILFLGQIRRLKNVGGLISAFAKVREQVPQATLHIGGPFSDMEYYRECMDAAKALGVAQSISFLGNLDRAAVRMELSRASCLALLSYQENAPMVVAEAMAAGVPTVASRVCGLPYMIDDGRTGFLVSPENSEEILAKLIEMLRDGKANAEMGRRCRAVAMERFHAAAVAKKTLEVYRTALTRSGEAKC